MKRGGGRRKKGRRRKRCGFRGLGYVKVERA
jgi:hypothetical protein